MRKTKRLNIAVSAALAVLMIISMVPAGVFAEDAPSSDGAEAFEAAGPEILPMEDERDGEAEEAAEAVPEADDADGEDIPEPPGTSTDSEGSFVTENGKLYYYDANGNMAVSRWIITGGKRYFASRSGVICTDCFISLLLEEKPVENKEEGLKNYRETVTYYMGLDGSVQSGIVSTGGKYYFCDPENDDRVFAGGWVRQGGKRYYASEDGSFYVNRFISFGDEGTYFMGSDGSVQSGMVYTGGKYYFCDPKNDDRLFAGGWLEYNGKKYYAGSDGALFANQFISFGDSEKYYAGADGSIQSGILHVNGKYYYADPSNDCRIAMSGWVVLDKKYYASADGSFFTDTIITISSKEKYYVGSTGAVQTGINKYEGEYYYCDSAEGGKIAMNKWVEAGGNRYFASSTGAFYTSQFIHFGDLHYYMDAYGRVVREPFVVRGITITPDPVTGAISQAVYDSIYDYSSPLPYDNYVLVDIPSQTLRYYVNGFEALFTYVVTGDAYLHPTPTGTFYLNGGKAQNVTLVGEDYETPVNYWMPFIGGAYGMHDATWRSAFGGTIYRGNGSHGCVNMPYEKAKELYFMIPVGTMVIVR